MQRQRIKKSLTTAGVMVACILAIAVIGNLLRWNWISIWTWLGLNGGYHKVTITSPIKGGGTKAEEQPPAKTLWDWLQLAIIPAVLAGIGLWFTQVQKSNEQTIAGDNQHEKSLQDYIDKMSELLLKERLFELEPMKDSPVEQESHVKSVCEKARNIARVRTITILFQLDARRVGYVFTFLREAGLMSGEPNSSIVSLSRANLSEIDLSQAHLREANFNEAFLIEANLSKANLGRASLRGAKLYNANLSGTILQKADLSGANLQGAFLCGANLIEAKLICANFDGGNLSKACLREAVLREAVLQKADLSGANLQGAFLRGANLSGAVLDKADLSGADLYKANLSGAILDRANLTGAKNTTETQIRAARSHKDTIKPDGSKYSP